MTWLILETCACAETSTNCQTWQLGYFYCVYFFRPKKSVFIPLGLVVDSSCARATDKIVVLQRRAQSTINCPSPPPPPPQWVSSGKYSERRRTKPRRPARRSRSCARPRTCWSRNRSIWSRRSSKRLWWPRRMHRKTSEATTLLESLLFLSNNRWFSRVSSGYSGAQTQETLRKATATDRWHVEHDWDAAGGVGGCEHQHDRTDHDEECGRCAQERAFEHVSIYKNKIIQTNS